MSLKIKRASKEELSKMLINVKRFDSGEFVTVLSKFANLDYIEYGANGNSAVLRAIKAVNALHPSRHFITRAVSQTHRVVIRVPKV